MLVQNINKTEHKSFEPRKILFSEVIFPSIEQQCNLQANRTSEGMADWHPVLFFSNVKAFTPWNKQQVIPFLGHLVITTSGKKTNFERMISLYVHIHLMYILCTHIHIHIYDCPLQVEVFIHMAPTFNLLCEPQ